MKFDTIINNCLYTIHGELEGDHETPETIIDSIEFYHCTKDKIVDIPKKHLNRFYERFKKIIDNDAMEQAKFNKNH